MSMYQPSQLRLFLEEHGLAAKKGLSQNFLVDGNILRKIVAAAQVGPEDVVLEIGPGPGALTEQLLMAGAHVIAVEKDEGFARVLSRLDTHGRLEVFCDDIMKFPTEDIVKSRLKPGTKAKIIANLPYHLTTPIINNFVTKKDVFSLMTVMVQEEVARRMTGNPNTSEYGSLTVFLNYYSDVVYEFRVSRHCFYPEPKVDSAIVTLLTKNPPMSEQETVHFFLMTRTAFKHRRKMLRGSLKDLYPSLEIEKGLESIGKDIRARPEELSLEQWLQLYTFLKLH